VKLGLRRIAYPPADTLRQADELIERVRDFGCWHFATCWVHRAMSEFGLSGKTYDRTEFFSL